MSKEYNSNIHGRVRRLTQTKTRPANTTAYAAGDVINESASAGTNITFSGAGKLRGSERPADGGVITSAMIVDSASEATQLDAELWLFSVAPTADNDNAAFTPTDAEMLNLIGVIPFGNSFVGTASGNVALTSGYIHIPYVCANNDIAIYGVLVARNAYTPISGEVFTIILDVL